MNRKTTEMIIVGMLFLISSLVAMIRVRKRYGPSQDQESARRSLKEHALTLLSLLAMLIFLELFLRLVYKLMVE